MSTVVPLLAAVAARYLGAAAGGGSGVVSFDPGDTSSLPGASTFGHLANGIGTFAPHRRHDRGDHRRRDVDPRSENYTSETGCKRERRCGPVADIPLLMRGAMELIGDKGPAMSGEVLAAYGPMGALSSGLGGEAARWEDVLGVVTEGSGNPSLDAALDRLACAVNSKVRALGWSCQTAGKGVRTVSEHFAAADA